MGDGRVGEASMSSVLLAVSRGDIILLELCEAAFFKESHRQRLKQSESCVQLFGLVKALHANH